MDKISTGCDSIDSLLNGGFEREIISQIYGLPSTGKTNIALQTAVENIKKGNEVVYIDTEGLSFKRLDQISGDKSEKIKEKIRIKEVLDFKDQTLAIKNVKDLASNCDLLVLDSATGLYRVQRNKQDEREVLNKLGSQLTLLSSLARRYNMAVLVTNQVYTNVDKNYENEPLGGKIMEYWSKTILKLEKDIEREDIERDFHKSLNQGRKAILEKHRSISSGDFVFFKITECGVEEI